MIMLAEVKYLKLWQEDLNRRTQQLDLDAAGKPREAMRERYDRLADEQARLATATVRLLGRQRPNPKTTPTRRKETQMTRIRLKIENCKLQIANCRKALYAARRPLVSPFFNLQFSIFNLQFLFLFAAVCSLAAADPPAPCSHPPTTLSATASTRTPATTTTRAAGRTEQGGRQQEGPRQPTTWTRKLKQQLGPAANREDQSQHPLLLAAKGMCDVQTRLADGKSDAITQHVQRQVVADLQKIIDEAKKSGKCLGQSCTSGNCTVVRQGRRWPSRPERVAAAQANDTPARQSNPNAVHRQPRTEEEQLAYTRMQEQFKIQLQAHPPDTRYELPSDHFLPEYEREIQDYFRRLSAGTAAEERP